MKNLIKLTTFILLTCLIQACAFTPETPYHAYGHTADLMIVTPPEYESSLEVNVYENGGNYINGRVMNTDNTLLYDRNIYAVQGSKIVKVSANRKLIYRVHYSVNSNQYCDNRFSVTLDQGGHYRLLAGVSFDKSGNILHMLGLFRQDKCVVALSEIVNGRLVAVKISKE